MMEGFFQQTFTDPHRSAVKWLTTKIGLNFGHSDDWSPFWNILALFEIRRNSLTYMTQVGLGLRFRLGQWKICVSELLHVMASPSLSRRQTIASHGMCPFKVRRATVITISMPNQYSVSVFGSQYVS